ncbi:MAG: hypothetical protein ACO1ON_13035 [Nocardioides sp.]
MKKSLAAIVAAAALTVITPTTAHAGDPIIEVTEWFSMPLPEGGWTAKPTEATATWDQPHDPDRLACGSWWQVDDWKGKKSEIEAILADGMLSMTPEGPEDRNVIQRWDFVEQPPCAEPEPTQTPVTPAPQPEPEPTETPVAEEPNEGRPNGAGDWEPEERVAEAPVAELAETGVAEFVGTALFWVIVAIGVGGSLVVLRYGKGGDAE